MGRLCIAAVDCYYQEVDRQLNNGLNEKYMLEEIIKELMATKTDDHITSSGMLAGTKRVETQRAQASVLNTMTQSRQFNKVRISKETKDDKARAPVNQTMQQQPCRYCDGIHQPRQYPAYGEMCAQCGNMGHFKVCCSKRSRVVNKMEQERSQEYSEAEIEMVSINSVYMNKN